MNTDNNIKDILTELSRPLPENKVRQRVGWRDANGAEHWIDYIDWHTAADILDEVAVDWSHEVRDLRVIGDLVVVTAAITIKGITRCGVGVGSAMDEKGIKRAEHDALKRAAVKFGLARSLYNQSKDKREIKPVKENREDKHSGEEPATEKQIAAIYAIAKAKSLDAELESRVMFRCEPERLTRSSASQLIDHLRSIRISA
jgi:hypothetical protein